VTADEYNQADELVTADEYNQLLQQNKALKRWNAKLRKQEKVELRKQMMNESQSRTLRRLKAQNFGLLDDAEKLQAENEGLHRQITMLLELHSREYKEIQKAAEEQKRILTEANEELRHENRKYRKHYKQSQKQSEELKRENIAIIMDKERLKKELERYKKKIKKLKSLRLRRGREKEKERSKKMQREGKTAPAKSGNDAMSLSSGRKQGGSTGYSEKQCSLTLLSLLSRKSALTWNEERQWRRLDQKTNDVISYESEPNSSDLDRAEEKAHVVHSPETSRGVEDTGRLRTPQEYIKDFDKRWNGEQYDMEGRKIIVRNIPSGDKDSLETKLCKTFERYGEVVEYFVIRTSKIHDDDECSNFGFVTFTEASSADKAIEAASVGRLGPLEVERARPRKSQSYRQSSNSSHSNKRFSRRGQRYDSLF